MNPCNDNRRDDYLTVRWCAERCGVPPRPVDDRHPDCSLLSAWDAVVRRRYGVVNQPRAQSDSRERKCRSRRKAKVPRNQVEMRPGVKNPILQYSNIVAYLSCDLASV